MKKGKVEASVFLLGAIILLVTGGILFSIFTLRTDPLDDVFSGDRVINTLFITEHEKKPLSSFVLMYYPPTNRTAMFDIPGEVGLILTKINRVDRIDTVYNPSNISPYEDEIEKLLGLDMTFSVVITLENLGKIVDLLGGVEIIIPSRLSLFEENPPVIFPSGKVRLDGEKAMRYVSFNVSEEDRESVHSRRQRFFLGFLGQLGEQREYLANPQISRLFMSLIESRAAQQAQIRLFNNLANIDTDRILLQTVSGNLREVSGQMLILPYWDGNQIKEVVRQNLSTLTRHTEGGLMDRIFTVEILNGTATPGLARRTAEIIQGFGYDVISVSNAETSDYDATEIIDRSGFEEMAKTFGGIIRCGNIRSMAIQPEDDIMAQNLEVNADFTLIIGRDFNGRYVSSQ